MFDVTKAIKRFGERIHSEVLLKKKKEKLGNAAY